MIRLLRKFKLTTRLFLFFLIFVIIPSMLISLSIKTSMDNIWFKSAENYALSSQKIIQDNIELMVEKKNILYLKLLTNKDLYLYADNKSLSFSERQDKIYEIVGNLSSNPDKKEYGHIITNNGDIFSLSAKSIPYNSDTEYLNKIKSGNMAVWNGTITDTEGNTFYPYGRNLSNFNTGHRLGVIILYISESELYDTYKNVALEHGAVCILNDKNQIISSAVPELTGSNLFAGSLFSMDETKIRTLEYDKNQYIISNHDIVSKNKNMPLNWSIVSVIPQGIYYSAMNRFSKMMNVIQIIFLIVIAILTLYFSKKIVSPLLQLEKNLQRFGRGDLSVSIPMMQNSDEISDLNNIYYAMLIQIKNLINKNNLEKEKQRNAEYKALQAQINPHFIYNTLDAISWMAKMKEQPDIEEIVYALSSFFKISLHNGDKFITVEEELNHIKSYVTIEHIRFPDRIKFEYEIEDGILKRKMIKTILQPIVENAIKHGFYSNKMTGTILIRGYEKEDKIIFEIIDNGNGFDVETLSSTQGFGIKNIIERIDLEYKNEGKITFESAPKNGTKVTVILKIID